VKVVDQGTAPGTTWDDHPIVVRPVAVVRTARREVVDDHWGAVSSRLELVARHGAEVWRGLEAFSHLEVVYHFHLVAPEAVCTAVRRPRGRPDWPEVGIFAQRAKDRPNRIGVSVCELVAVEGRALVVRGLDAVDGTPVLDVKPYLTEFAPRGPVRQPPWASELMEHYWE
jgi:tRNA-Thr(GGU) m(6)t(6)A37 methyltransferase TsaA